MYDEQDNKNENKDVVGKARETFERLWQQRSSLMQRGVGSSRDAVGRAWQQRPGLSGIIEEQYREFAAAVRFLTVIPVPGSNRLFRTDAIEQDVAIGSGYFSLVGLLLALLLAILPFGLGSYLPTLVLATLVIIAQVLLTGGLHMDGLMDACDGLFSGASRERKLEIMRDSRVGSFGMLGGACVLLLKFALFSTLGAHALPLALLIVLPTARWSMVLAVYLFPSARPTGMGPAFRQTVTLPRLILAGGIALLAALVLGQLLGLAVWLIATLAALAVGAWAKRALGGLTGDIYGAINEVAEMVGFLIMALF